VEVHFNECFFEADSPKEFQVTSEIYIILCLPVRSIICLSIYGSTALVDLGRFFIFLNCTQSVGLLGRGIIPSQGRYLNTEQHRHRINAYRHLWLEWDSNPRSQCSSRRKRFILQTARVTVIGCIIDLTNGIRHWNNPQTSILFYFLRRLKLIGGKCGSMLLTHTRILVIHGDVNWRSCMGTLPLYYPHRPTECPLQSSRSIQGGALHTISLNWSTWIGYKWK
jgi:hypothetical protein